MRKRSASYKFVRKKLIKVLDKWKFLLQYNTNLLGRYVKEKANKS